MEKEYKMFRRFDTIKRLILLFFILYVVAAMSIAEVRAALPGIGEVCDFYIRLIHALISVIGAEGR